VDWADALDFAYFILNPLNLINTFFSQSTTRALLAEGGARRLYRGLFPEIIGKP